MNDINIYSSRLKLNNINEAYDQLLRKQTNSDGLDIAICLKENDEFIGHLFDERNNDTFGICWNLLNEHSKKGYAYEAAYAYMDHLFKQ